VSRMNTIHIVMQNMFYLLRSPELSVRVVVLEVFRSYLKLLGESDTVLYV
jgi:hypothetical protein